MTLDLNHIRKDIDQIDHDLVQLLERRMACVSQIIAYKREHHLPILDNTREQEVLKKVDNLISNQDYRETILATFDDIMARSRAFQAQKNP